MSEFAWLGVIVSAAVSTLALGSYFVMAVPYFDDAPRLNELKENTRTAMLIGLVMFGIFFVIFYLGGLYMNEDNSGPLLVFAAFILGLPTGLLLGSETWDWRSPKAMNKLPGMQAVLVATGIGLAEIIGFSLLFMLLVRLG